MPVTEQNFMQVSVIIPAFNVARYLEDSVQSALDQPETAEVIIIDDGSKDDSLQIAKKLEAKHPDKIRVLTHPNGENLGSAATRNVGIKAAKYEFIAFIDADDYYMPNRFARTKKIFAENLDIDGVYEAIENFFEANAKSYTSNFPLDRVPTLHMVNRVVPPEDLLELLLTDEMGIILLQGLCVKKSAFEKAGMFNPEFRVSQDMLMIKKIATAAHMMPGDLKQPVSRRRIHDSNISFSTFKDVTPTKYLEGEVLFLWAMTKNISAHKKNLLLRHYYKQYLFRNGLRYDDGAARRNFLKKVLSEYPMVILIKEFWKIAPVTGRFVK